MKHLDSGDRDERPTASLRLERLNNQNSYEYALEVVIYQDGKFVDSGCLLIEKNPTVELLATRLRDFSEHLEAYIGQE